MALISLRCGQCGGYIEFDSDLITGREEGFCVHCGTKFLYKDEIVNQNVYFQTTIIKNVAGADKTDAEEMIASAETLMNLGEWKKAKNVLDKAIESYPADWRVWFTFVRFYTAGFTNLADTHHFYYLDRAKTVADAEAGAQIDAFYAPFAKKAAAHRATAEANRLAWQRQNAQNHARVNAWKIKWVAISVPIAVVLLVTIILLATLLPGGGRNGRGRNGREPEAKTPAETPAETPGMLTTLSSGSSNTFALDENGALWEVKKDGFTQKKSDAPFIAVSSGEDSSFAIDTGGGLWAWTTGYSGNTFGQIGDGTTSSTKAPVRIKPDTTIMAVSAGGSHTLALDSDGGLWAWGYNASGQIGDGTTVNRSLPVRIQSGTRFQAVAAGSYCSFAIDQSGNLWGWGSSVAVSDNYLDVLTPMQKSSGIRFKTVIAGNYHALIIDEQDNLWALGYDSHGALGDGTTSSRKTPVQIKTGTKFKAADAGRCSMGGHSLALDESGGLWAWGYNQDGQLGTGIEINQSSPVAIMPGTKFTAVSAGEDFSVFIDVSGQLWACGKGYGATPVKIAK
ncbi:MAG: hypothetical protein FWD58_09205 [Firmicutes bacterium]|nr:hypothetical protein [Bacillota bacterium]